MSVKSVIASMIVLVGLASPVWAQATSASKLAWDQPDVATAADAQSATYKYYPNGATTGTTLTTPVTCTGIPPAVVTCQTTFPVFKAGSNTLTLTASNAAGESLPSTPLPFVYVVVPSAPSNLRVR